MIVDIFQDTVCPWCRIGHHHLMEALDQWQGEPVEVRFRAYELDPTVPDAGEPFHERMERKFGAGRKDQMFQQVVQAGANAGLTFNFDRIAIAPNTRLSHQVIALTPADQKQAVVEAIHRAHFEDGRDIGDVDELLAIAAAAGVDTAGMKDRLARKEGLDEVEADLAFARKVGITGVPFFIIANKYALTGAQPPSALLQALEQAQG